MGQTSDPKTLVIHKKLTPGNNTKNFKQHYFHSRSLQLHINSIDWKDINYVLLTLEDSICSRASSFGICGGQNDTGTDFAPSTPISLASIGTPLYPIHISFICCQ
jgi:hypothetical protein